MSPTNLAHDPVDSRPAAPRRTPLWLVPWVYFVAIFCGFMFAATGTAAVPSSALWTSAIVCSSPYHLVHQSSDTSYGNTSQTSTSRQLPSTR
jgi:hypothetical protein